MDVFEKKDFLHFIVQKFKKENKPLFKFVKITQIICVSYFFQGS